mmetsp:Transcript_61931/g.93541  ORF Transcript_61931/g.93541 Transcript_61931/m.93541 type:complete len:106 (+) Transcript_61931:106-423(+)
MPAPALRSAAVQSPSLQEFSEPLALPRSGARKIGTSKTGKLVPINEWVTTLPEGKPVVFVLGALAHGKVEVDYTEECISVSEFPLSGSVAAGKVCCAFEQLWGII